MLHIVYIVGVARVRYCFCTPFRTPCASALELRTPSDGLQRWLLQTLHLLLHQHLKTQPHQLPVVLCTLVIFPRKSQSNSCLTCSPRCAEMCCANERLLLSSAIHLPQYTSHNTPPTIHLPQYTSNNTPPTIHLQQYTSHPQHRLAPLHPCVCAVTLSPVAR